MIYNRINIRNLSYNIFWGLYVEKYDRLGSLYADVEHYQQDACFREQTDKQAIQLSIYLPPLNWFMWFLNIGGLARAWCVQKIAYYMENPSENLRWEPLVDRAVRVSRSFFTSAWVSSSDLIECIETYPDFGWFRNNGSVLNPNVHQRMSDKCRIAEIRARQCIEKKQEISKRRETYGEHDRADLAVIGINVPGNDFRQITCDVVKNRVYDKYRENHPDRGGDAENFEHVRCAANRLFENVQDRQLLEWCEKQIHDYDKGMSRVL